MIGPATLRSRFIRKMVLDQLADMAEGVPGTTLDAWQVYRAFDGCRTQFTRAEIDAELSDLVDHGLIALHRTPREDAPEQLGYTLTARGRDFHRAACPWERIDEFTGGRR